MVKVFKKLKHIVLGWWYYIRGLNYELMEQRLLICRQCDKKINITKNIEACSICGCPLISKNRVKEERCPQNKW